MRIVGHGIDAVEISRIAEMLQSHGEQFALRCFTEAERSYADAGGKQRVQRYAVRFACKEAVMKALGTGWTGGIGWQDIEVLREPSGRPVLAVHGRCDEVAREMGVTQWHISLSHTQTLAIASVIASAAGS